MAQKGPEDPLVEEEDSDDEEEDNSDAASTSSTSSSASVDTNGKKKKKKKKKKRGKAAAAEAAAPAQAPAQAPPLTKAQKAEADKRFHSAIEGCRGNGEMWLKLGGCNIHDAKAKKLVDVLKANSSITSLDLSSNHITDEGAQALASMLASPSGAAELIELDLRDNPLSPAALQALEAAAKSRKQLALKVGALQQPADERSSSGSGAGGKGEGEGGKEVTKGPMFKKYFQSGDEDDETSSGQGDGEGPLGDGGMAPDELWSEVKALVAAGTASIPQLSNLLQQLIGHLNRELGTLPVPPFDAAVDGSRPHIKGCIMNLEALGSVLDVVPREVTMQYTTDAPQPAVGSHRVWATEVVSTLLAHNLTAVDNLVARSKLVPRVFAISLVHPMCSALHTRALRILRSSCVSKVSALYAPLFTAGLGIGSTVAGSEELSGSLQQQLADRAALALGVPSGRRSPVMGFVLEACKVMRHCCDEVNTASVYNTNVRRLLQMDPKWSEFVSEGGLLAQLCKEQEGDLGGPRAARMQMEESQEMAEMAGGGLISSHEILALLHGMSTLGMQASSGQ